MQIFNNKIVLLALISCNLITPLKADFNIAEGAGGAIGVGIGTGAAYIYMTHLIQKDFLVTTKYPHAQAWYNAMDEKYPVAQLHKKLFLQKMWGMPKALVSWCSSFKHIYFPQSALIRINSLYGMLENNQILSYEDNLFLAEQEFMLLHEAGHIEHGDIKRKQLCAAALAFVVGGSFHAKKCDEYNTSLNLPKKLTCDFTLTSAQDKNLLPNPTQLWIEFNPIIRLIDAGTSALFMKLLLSRYHERHADAFAYTHGDDNALKGGISFFQSNMVDPLFEIEKSQPSPYINTHSTIGSIAQSTFSIFETPIFYIGKTIGTVINSTDVTRWLYDAARGLTHPGGPARVAAIQKELQRRAQAQKKW